MRLPRKAVVQHKFVFFMFRRVPTPGVGVVGVHRGVVFCTGVVDLCCSGDVGVK